MKIKTLVFTSFVLLLMLGVLPTYADEIPALPHAFYGDVTINEDPAPNDTQISATVASGDIIATQNPVVTVNGNYGIDGLHLLVQGDGLSGAITFYVNGVEVEGATATFEAGGGPTEINLDLVSDVTAQKVETVAAGQTDYPIDFPEAGIAITVNTIGEVTITVKKYADNPYPGAGGLPANVLPIYIDIDIDVLENIAWPMRVEQTYTDADVAGLDESSLGMYYFKASAWHECSDTGVTTVANTIWANMLKAELSGSPIAFGEIVAPTPEPTPEPPVGGGGGVGGDTVAPSISSITTIAADTYATIAWKTSESSLTWLLYGTTTDYGTEIKSTDYKKTHSEKLTDLATETTYHFQIKSKDSAGNIGSYTDKTFTTLALGEVPVVKPISEMTIAELKAEIARIAALIADLQAQLAALIGIEGVPADFTFDTNLKYRMSGTEVKYLQIVLNSAADTQVAETSWGSPGNETEYFGSLTRAAVIKFQEKYQEDVLAPWELTEGTGFVGSTTRDKLNELLGK